MHRTDLGPVDGTAVVFSHGAGADGEMFAAQARALAGAGYRAITYDLRGHGGSPGVFSAAAALDDLASIVAELDRPALVGQSLGGNLSQAFVKAHPSLVRGLVVIGSAHNAGPLSALDRFFLRLAGPSLSLIPAARLGSVMANASAATPAGRDYALRVFSAMPKKSFVDVFAATTSFLDPDVAYRTPVPLLLMRGDSDSTGNIATGMPRWAEIEGVDEVVVPGAGHIANVDAPSLVSAALLEFLAR